MLPFQQPDQHRLTLNKDILAATLILARASVLTSAEKKEEREERERMRERQKERLCDVCWSLNRFF